MPKSKDKKKKKGRPESEKSFRLELLYGSPSPMIREFYPTNFLKEGDAQTMALELGRDAILWEVDTNIETHSADDEVGVYCERWTHRMEFKFTGNPHSYTR